MNGESVSSHCYVSSVLRCHDGGDGCKVCAFLNGSRSEETLLHVIRVLDDRLADTEKTVTHLASAFANNSPRKCSKCKGSGQEMWRPGDYTDCSACGGKGH